MGLFTRILKFGITFSLPMILVLQLSFFYTLFHVREYAKCINSHFQINWGWAKLKLFPWRIRLRFHRIIRWIYFQEPAFSTHLVKIYLLAEGLSKFTNFTQNLSTQGVLLLGNCYPCDKEIPYICSNHENNPKKNSQKNY